MYYEWGLSFLGNKKLICTSTVPFLIARSVDPITSSIWSGVSKPKRVVVTVGRRIEGKK